MSAEYVETGFIKRTETPTEKRGLSKAGYVLERLVSYLVQEDRSAVAYDDNLSHRIHSASYRPIYEVIRIGMKRVDIVPLVIHASDMLAWIEAHGIRSHREASSSR